MRKIGLGMAVMVGIIWVAAAAFGQTNLTVVRHADNTLWKMTCDGTTSCSSWTKISGRFSVQPTLTWDPSIQKYILIGIGNDKTSIWRGTFEPDGTWNDDWTLITGTSPSPVAITAGKVKGYFRNVAVVAPSGGDYTNPAVAMGAYASWCGTPSDTNPCLLKIMPGVYDIGTSTVLMQPYIDIEGSGQNVTVITGTATNAGFPPTNGVVNGASNAEIRFLTVENAGGGAYHVAILNISASPAITNVTASASGGTTGNLGVYNESSSPTMTNVAANGSGGTSTFNSGVYNNTSPLPTMTNVTATASGGAYSYGVQNVSSSPTMINVTANASEGTTSVGVRNYTSSSLTMTNVTATGSGVTNSRGVHNYSSSPTMTNVTASASGASSSNYGVYNESSSSPTMIDVTAIASGGTTSTGVRNTSSSPTMTNVIATASGGVDSLGVYNASTSSSIMINVTATGKDGATNYGLKLAVTSTAIIDRSTFEGSTNSITAVSGNTLTIAGSKLVGAAKGGDGTYNCVLCYKYIGAVLSEANGTCD